MSLEVNNHQVATCRVDLYMQSDWRASRSKHWQLEAEGEHVVHRSEAMSPEQISQCKVELQRLRGIQSEEPLPAPQQLG